MLYPVTHKKEQWHVGNAPCEPEEAREWLARSCVWINYDKADRIMNSILNKQRKK